MRLRWWFLFVSGLVLAWNPASLLAQAVGVTVLDAVTGSPVEGATVMLTDGTGATAGSGSTDDLGRVEFDAGVARTVMITVSALGYQRFASDPIEPDGEGSLELLVRLGVDALPLEPLTVVTQGSAASTRAAGFERRRTDPTLGGAYLTGEDIRARPMATPTQLVRALPSVSVQQIVTPSNPLGTFDRSLIWFPMSRGGGSNLGYCLADVFIDGVRVRQSLDASPDDLLVGVPLYGVEVYPRALSAPLEYRGTNECGVVLYWTDEPEVTDGGWTWKRLAIGGGLVGMLVVLAVAR
jgi:hypothetical protein